MLVLLLQQVVFLLLLASLESLSHRASAPYGFGQAAKNCSESANRSYDKELDFPSSAKICASSLLSAEFFLHRIFCSRRVAGRALMIMLAR